MKFPWCSINSPHYSMNPDGVPWSFHYFIWSFHVVDCKIILVLLKRYERWNNYVNFGISVHWEVPPLVNDHETVCKENFGEQLLGALSGFTEVLLRSGRLTGTEDIKLVANLATRAFDGTVVFLGVYLEVLGGIIEGVCPLPQVSKVYCSKDIKLIPHLATRALGGAVINPSVDQGVLEEILGGFVFYHVSLKCTV